ncbi:MAG: acetyl-CoA carboxylase biotin carboxylase subunit [Vampirovibrionales bacterium]|nr:acetyl-CoA carboxylase biotin carboxylase subunit [Vampirovibrionales bacterium]
MSNTRFSKVMVVNRGEIALRVIRGIQAVGLTAVAVYSDADTNSLHRKQANEAYRLAGDSATDTYLNMDAILTIAKQAGVHAIHPGYGFLSENATFAQRCADAGLIFIGPSPKVITAMGDKIAAKQAMTQADVPVVPGITLDDAFDSKAVAKDAKAIGYPVLVKAAAGGGGKGMRLVYQPEELEAAIDSSRREAAKAFGDGRVFVEKYIERPRHVEIQVMGDHHGNVVHLFERECSIQRRHQKIVEESPSPALSNELREVMGNAAVAAAKAIGYTNAGTVEFILAPDGSFYFLEVNTRLQVEHPVTELVTGVDLVRWQLLIAQGEALPLTQQQLHQRGHAVECRIYAEDPAHGFLPATGTLHYVQWPQGPNIRVDAGVETGSEVGIHYDPMLTKLIVWGESRAVALQTMEQALQETILLGVTTNVGFLLNLIQHPEFQLGNIHTHFLTEHPIETATHPSNALWSISALALTEPSALGKVRQQSSSNRGDSATPLKGLHHLATDLAAHWRLHA